MDKYYSYRECLEFNRKKSIIIEQLLLRADKFYDILLESQERNERLDPDQLIQELMKIERKYPLCQ